MSDWTKKSIKSNFNKSASQINKELIEDEKTLETNLEQSSVPSLKPSTKPYIVDPPKKPTDKEIVAWGNNKVKILEAKQEQKRNNLERQLEKAEESRNKKIDAYFTVEKDALEDERDSIEARQKQKGLAAFRYKRSEQAMEDNKSLEETNERLESWSQRKKDAKVEYRNAIGETRGAFEGSCEGEREKLIDEVNKAREDGIIPAEKGAKDDLENSNNNDDDGNSL
ncbi:MAG: hypothetical protein ACSHX0_13285 [Akkermansiaceae bacterium]